MSSHEVDLTIILLSRLNYLNNTTKLSYYYLQFLTRKRESKFLELEEVIEINKLKPIRMTKSSKSNKTLNSKANDKPVKRVKKHIAESDDERSRTSEPISTNLNSSSQEVNDDDNQFFDEEDEVEIELDNLSINSEKSDESEKVEEGQVNEKVTINSVTSESVKYDISKRFSDADLKHFISNRDFNDRFQLYQEELSHVVSYELLKDDSTLTPEEIESFAYHSGNLRELYEILALKGLEIKKMDRLKKKQS